jgi:hypothetical protein
VRDLDPQLACVLVVLESRNQQRRRVAGGQCHTAPPITSNGARGKAGASTWVSLFVGTRISVEKPLKTQHSVYYFCTTLYWRFALIFAADETS